MGVGGEQPVPIPKFDATGEQQGYWKVDEVSHVDAFSQAQSAREGTALMNTGTEHLSSLRAAYLKSLADKTGLSYRRLGSAEEFSEQMRIKSLGIPKVITTDMRWLFALGALLAFMATLLFAPLPKMRS